MERSGYSIGWLLPDDAAEAAALEERTHPAEHRAGEQLIAAQLETTECDARNLSLGLYHCAAGATRPVLVGFVLAFLMRSRREMAEFFDAPIPEALDADGRTIYIADWAIEQAHRRAFKFMAEHLADVLASDGSSAFAAVERIQHARVRGQMASAGSVATASGYRFVADYAYRTIGSAGRCSGCTSSRSRAGGCTACAGERRPARVPRRERPARLGRPAPRLDRLLEASPDRTPWQSYAFLTLWWRYLAGNRALRIFVVERGGVPCLRCRCSCRSGNVSPGLPVRLLEPIGMVMDVNRPRLALGAFDEAAYRCAFDAMWGLRDDWHVVRVDEKPWDDREIALLRDYGVAHGCVFRQVFSHLVPYLDLRQSWQTYFGALAEIAQEPQGLSSQARAARCRHAREPRYRDRRRRRLADGARSARPQLETREAHRA